MSESGCDEDKKHVSNVSFKNENIKSKCLSKVFVMSCYKKIKRRAICFVVDGAFFGFFLITVSVMLLFSEG